MAESSSTRAGGSSTVHQEDGRGRAIGVGIGLTLLGVILTTILSPLFAGPALLTGSDFESTPVLLLQLIGGQIAFLLTGIFYLRQYGLAVPVTVPDRYDLGYAVGGIVAALVFVTAAGQLLMFLGLAPDGVLEEFLMEDPMLAIWMAVLSIVLIAPAEEFLFRGVIQGRLRRTFGAPSAILLASLCFASLHFWNYSGSTGALLGGTLLIAGVGIIFGVLYERTDTLTAPVIAHAIYNAILFAVEYFIL